MTENCTQHGLERSAAKVVHQEDILKQVRISLSYNLVKSIQLLPTILYQGHQIQQHNVSQMKGYVDLSAPFSTPSSG